MYKKLSINSRFILLFLFNNILEYPVIRLHIMICNVCIGIRCKIQLLLPIFHHHHLFLQCHLSFLNHYLIKHLFHPLMFHPHHHFLQCHVLFLNHYLIKHLFHPLHSLKISLRWVLGWITMLSYCKDLIRLMPDSTIKDIIVPLLLTLNLVLSCLHHKSINMSSIFNMRQ